jgi:hypothetical protein
MAVDQFLTGLSVLESSPLVQRARMAGDHLRVVVNNGINQDAVKRALEECGVCRYSQSLSGRRAWRMYNQYHSLIWRKAIL